MFHKNFCFLVPISKEWVKCSFLPSLADARNVIRDHSPDAGEKLNEASEFLLTVDFCPVDRCAAIF